MICLFGGHDMHSETFTRGLMVGEAVHVGIDLVTVLPSCSSDFAVDDWIAMDRFEGRVSRTAAKTVHGTRMYSLSVAGSGLRMVPLTRNIGRSDVPPRDIDLDTNGLQASGEEFAPWAGKVVSVLAIPVITGWSDVRRSAKEWRMDFLGSARVAGTIERIWELSYVQPGARTEVQAAEGYGSWLVDFRADG